tara:strand:- start:2245 stop:2397 length:153 start_codon:yes stop_codon:yes gene_type:complete
MYLWSSSDREIVGSNPAVPISLFILLMLVPWKVKIDVVGIIFNYLVMLFF